MTRKDLVERLKEFITYNPSCRHMATPLAAAWLTDDNSPEIKLLKNSPEFDVQEVMINRICSALEVPVTRYCYMRNSEEIAVFQFDLTSFDNFSNDILEQLALFLPECRIKPHHQYDSEFDGMIVGVRGETMQLNVIKDHKLTFYGEVPIAAIKDADLERRWVELVPNTVIRLWSLERLRYM